MRMVQTRKNKTLETLGTLYIYIVYFTKEKLSRKETSFVSCTHKNDRNVSTNVINSKQNKKIEKKNRRREYVLEHTPPFLCVKSEASNNKKIYYIRGKATRKKLKQ